MLHRLNRTEYANAVRDLLGVTVDVTELLPSDGGDFGFDNIAAALRTSPMLLERYLTAALRVSDLAVGDADVRSPGPPPIRSAPSSPSRSTSMACHSVRAAVCAWSIRSRRTASTCSPDGC